MNSNTRMASEYNKLQNIESVCHCCLEECEVKSKTFRGLYYEMLTNCFDKGICPDERNSSNFSICATCVDKLKQCSSFRKQVEETQKKLYPVLIVKEETTDITTCAEDVGISNYIAENSGVIEVMGKTDDFVNNTETTGDINKKDDLAEAFTQSPERIAENDSDNTDDSNSWGDDCSKSLGTENEDKSKNERPSVYICDTCKKSFARRGGLINHIKTHVLGKITCEYCKVTILSINLASHIDKVHSCSTCESKFVSKEDRARHMEKIHNVFKSYSCCVCNEVFMTIRLYKSHLNIHKQYLPNDSLSCDICNQVFPTREQLTAHKTTHSVEKNFQCLLCSKTYRRRSTWRSHVMKMHDDTAESTRQRNTFCVEPSQKQKLGNIRKIKQAIDRKPYELKKTDVICPVCNVNMLTHNCLRRHMSIHYPIHVCHTCGKAFACRNTFSEHVRNHKEKKVNCKYCNKPVTHRSLLSHIKRVHLAKKIHPCSMCEDRFKNEYERVTHIEKIHNVYESFTCSMCSKVFNFYGKYKAHLATHNPHKQPSANNSFPCDICRKVLPTVGQLNSHRKTHSTERNFQCHLCPKTYKLRYMLTRHVKAHDDAAEKYICRVCNGKFVVKYMLKRHMKRVHDVEVDLNSLVLSNPTQAQNLITQ